jgi:predicted ATPase/class 3 adenylate cyclase/DNA-binding CsgD family transcriptional regulator
MVDDVSRGTPWPLLVGAGMTGEEPRAFTLPTGTVTFLLSDVEGSTRRWEESPEAMAIAIPRHYQLLDEAIQRHGGVRPVEQGEGDSVVAAFSRASDAVAAALDAQRTLTDEPWPEGADVRVRLAVHTGEAQLRDDGNYLGHALNRCARIRATGHGGQVLLSAASAALVADRLPDGANVTDLGLQRLRDLERPEHIWQLDHPSLPSVFPPLRSLDQFHHNLPAQLTPLVGRSREIAEVHALCRDERVVTLTGSAGVGKTRLALAVAAEALDAHAGGVWWVELAPLADPAGIGRAALAALGAREVAGAPLAHQLAVELGDEPSLVIFDNCEHLVEVCAELVADLLTANASTAVLTTSREPLGVPGEVTYRVPSLPCPKPERAIDIPALSQYDAVVLFVERARRARPSFTVTDANAPALAQICYRLDGIPLAIELAAARCRQMSVERIANELDDRFRLLTGGARTVMPRQQTLAASVDWSHERLEEGERLAFRRLGVFAGAFPLEAAEAVVASAGGLDQVEVFDLLSRLVDKSLLVADEGPLGEPRYRLLETLRAYALDRARAADELSHLRDAHASWWYAWLEPRWAMPTDAVVAEAEEVHDNLRAALDWSVDDPAIGLRMLRRLARIWTVSGRPGEAMPAVDRLLTPAAADVDVDAWLAAANGASMLLFLARGPEASAQLLASVVRIAEQRGDDYRLALARWQLGQPGGAAALLPLARAAGDRYLEVLLTGLVAADLAEDEPAAAMDMLDGAEAMAASTGCSLLVDSALMARVNAARAAGDLALCIELAERILQTASPGWSDDAIRELGFAGLLMRNRSAVSTAVDTGDRGRRKWPGIAPWADTARHRLELLDGGPSEIDPDLPTTSASWPMSTPTLWLAGREAIDAGAPDIAVEGTRALARYDSPHRRAALASVEAAANGDEDRWHDALAIAVDRGLRLIAVDAVEGLAVAAAGAESWVECLRLLGAAARLRDETGYRWRFAFEESAATAARDAARAALGDDASDAAEAEGRALDWRDAAAYASRARGERKRPSHGWASLTPTERRVVALVGEGLTNPQIAERLLMGRATVKTHIGHVFTKLGVRTRAELAAQVVRQAPM